MASTEPTANGSAQPEPTAPDAAIEAAPESAQNENEAEKLPEQAEAVAVDTEKIKWPGWPGYCVFRLVVPVLKVGSIIGRKGDLVKKMSEETRARIRVLDGPLSSPDRIVLISGKEEPEAALSPAMDAIIRVFKRISGLPESEGDSKALGAAGVAFCSIRLLVASTQAISLIGKQGSLIKSIQEGTSASVRVLSNDELPIYAGSDERIVELQGEALKVLKALEAVAGHLRKFLVDQSVLPLFEKNYNTPAIQEPKAEPWLEKASLHPPFQSGLGGEYPLSTKRDSLFSTRENHLETQSTGLSLYGQDLGFSAIRSGQASGLSGIRSAHDTGLSGFRSGHDSGLSGFRSGDSGLSGIRSSGLGRTGGPIVTQIAQTMQIPLTYAEDIIGVGGANIAYIRRTSGAILTVQESRGLPDEITVEIKGTSTQVEVAQQLIQDFISGHKETHQGSYGDLDSGLRPSYSELRGTSYQSSSYGGQPYGGYGSSGVGGYSSYRI